MATNDLKQFIWDAAAIQIQKLTEPVTDEREHSICQCCRDTFWATHGEWFCNECEEKLGVAEKQAIRANIEYWIGHGGESAELD